MTLPARRTGLPLPATRLNPAWPADLAGKRPARQVAQPAAYQVVVARPMPTPPRRRWRWQLISAAVAAGLILLAGVAWLLVQLVLWVTAHVWEILGGLALLILAATALAWAKAKLTGCGCPGLHCRGCRGH